MQIYLKRWHPSSYTVDHPHEIILDQNSPAHLRMRISEASGIPQVLYIIYVYITVWH